MGRLKTMSVAGTLLLILSAIPAAAQDEKGEKDEPDHLLQFHFKRRPSVRVGNVLRVDFRAKFQFDFRGYSPELHPHEDTFDLRSGRIGIEGNVLRHLQYEVERDFSKNRHPWRDVKVNIDYLDDIQIQAGRFKMPFGLEQTTGTTDLDFVYRSLLSRDLTPARQTGIMLHGRFFKRSLGYEAGVFRKDGENANYTGDTTTAVRLETSPLRILRVPAYAKTLMLRAAVTTTPVQESIASLQGRTISGSAFYPAVWVNGRRVRRGVELSWMPGPFSLKSEAVDVREDRKAVGVRGNDLPDLVSRAWYATGTWTVTHPLELAVRYEQLRFGSVEHPGLPSSGNRAANILGNSDRVLTLGLNWYASRWVKIQANSIREKLENKQFGPGPESGRDLFWTHVVRLQLVM